MTYQQIVVNDRPDGAWSLDSYPLSDVSGNNRYASGSRVYNYSANPTLATTAGLFGLGSATATRVVEEGSGIYGPSAIRVTATGTGSLGVAFSVPVSSSSSARTFTGGLWVQSDSGKSIRTHAEWNGGGANPTAGLSSSGSNTGWQFVRGSFTLPANATNFRVGALIESAVSGDSFLVSGHVVVEGSTLDPSTLNLNDMFNIRTVTAPQGTAYILSRPLPQETPLVANTGPAVRVTPDVDLEVDNNVFLRGKEREQFTLEAWFKPLSTPAEVTVLGHANGDGLTFDGDAIRFRTLYDTGGNCTVEHYPVDTERAHHAVGISTALTNQLWVDGVLVGEAVPTDAQLASKYPTSTTDVLVSGYSTDANASMIVDFPAIYSRALRADEIIAHYRAGRRTDDYLSVLGLYNGNFWTLDEMSTTFARQDAFSSADTWAAGQHTGVSSQTGTLIPEFDVDGTTLGGQWLFGYSLASVATTFTNSKIEWDGDGNVTVEFSTDDETWVPCVNGRGLPGLDDSAEGVSVRVVFPSGESLDTPTKMRFLRITLYTDITMTGSRGTRSIQWFGDVAPAARPFRPIEQSDIGRLETYGGYGVITPSNIDDGMPNIGGLEMWVKPTTLGADSAVLADFSWDTTPGARVWWNGTTWQYENCLLYINGFEVSTNNFTIPTNRWTHVVIVPSTPSDDAVRIFADPIGALPLHALVGHVAVYPHSLTPSEVGDIYGSYLGVESVYVSDSSVIAVQEPADALRVYAFNWSVRAG